MHPADLYASPNALAGDYSSFRVAARILLTGHPHQAWPDCGYVGQQQAWLDAAELVDDKSAAQHAIFNIACAAIDRRRVSKGCCLTAQELRGCPHPLESGHIYSGRIGPCRKSDDLVVVWKLC